MSRTFKTDPYRIKLRHPHRSGIHPRPVHNHTTQRCTLPKDPAEAPFRIIGGHECHWEWKYTGVNECGCRMCTNYWQRRWDRHRERHHGRRVTQKWLDEYENRPDSNTNCPGCGTDDDCNC